MTDIRDDQHTTTVIGGPGTVFDGEIERAGDVDIVRIELTAGKTYAIAVVQPQVPGTVPPSPVLDLFDENLGPVGGSVGGQAFANGDVVAQVVFTPSKGGTYFVSVGMEGWSESRQTGPYKILVGQPTSVAGDVASTIATTASLVIGGKTKGTIDYGGDQDWYRVDLQAGQTYRFDQLGRAAYGETKRGTLEAPLLLLYDSQGKWLAANGVAPATFGDDLFLFKGTLFFTPTQSGAYFLAASSPAVLDATGTYELHAQIDAPTLLYESSYTLQPGQPFRSTVENGDVLAVHLIAGNHYSFAMTALAGVDARMSIAWERDPLNPLQTGEDANGPNALLDFTPDRTGLYLLTAWNAGTVGQYDMLMTIEESSPPAAAAPGFRLFAPDGFSGEIGGTGMILGTSGFQRVEAAGRISFDPSFNRGGDVVRLSGDADGFMIARTGSSAILTRDDEAYTIPLGTAGTQLVFDDGARLLRFDSASGSARIGEQSFAGTPAAITAPAGDAELPGVADLDAAARLFLDAGAEVAIGGSYRVFGTALAEQISYVSGDLVLDPSFNRGGDTLHLGDPASAYEAVRTGSSVVLSSDQGTVTIPVGTAGMTIDFAGDARPLHYEAVNATIYIAGQAITSTAAPLDHLLAPASSFEASFATVG